MGEILYTIIILTLGILMGIKIESFINKEKVTKEIDLNKKLIRPQQKNDLDLIEESKLVYNKSLYLNDNVYLNDSEYLKYYNEPSSNIVVVKQNEDTFFEIQNIQKSNYKQIIIFRNTYMILLKIQIKGITKYILNWREID